MRSPPRGPTTSGNRALGCLCAQRRDTLVLTNTTIATSGGDAYGLEVGSGASATMSGGSVSTVTDGAFAVLADRHGLEISISGGTTITGRPASRRCRPGGRRLGGHFEWNGDHGLEASTRRRPGPGRLEHHADKRLGHRQRRRSDRPLRDWLGLFGHGDRHSVTTHGNLDPSTDQAIGALVDSALSAFSA